MPLPHPLQHPSKGSIQIRLSSTDIPFRGPTQLPARKRPISVTLTRQGGAWHGAVTNLECEGRTLQGTKRAEGDGWGFGFWIQRVGLGAVINPERVDAALRGWVGLRRERDVETRRTHGRSKVMQRTGQGSTSGYQCRVRSQEVRTHQGGENGTGEEGRNERMGGKKGVRGAGATGMQNQSFANDCHVSLHLFIHPSFFK